MLITTQLLLKLYKIFEQLYQFEQPFSFFGAKSGKAYTGLRH